MHIISNRKDIPQIIMAFLGPVILILGVYLTVSTAIHPVIIWLGVWLFIFRHNYILHNHIHNPFFTQKFPNRVMNIILGLAAGMPAGNWQIMHIHGHHIDHKIRNLESRAYLQRFMIPENLQPGFKNFFKFVIMNIVPQMMTPVIVLIKMALISKTRRVFALYYLLDYAIIILFLGIICFISPVSFMTICIIYLLVTMFSLKICYVTHIGVKSLDELDFANVCRNPLFNKLLWNFGHHVGHHYDGSVHWSDLPDYEKHLNIVANDTTAQVKSVNLLGLFLPPFLMWNATFLSVSK